MGLTLGGLLIQTEGQLGLIDLDRLGLTDRVVFIVPRPTDGGWPEANLLQL